jgi:hypothetical protein
LVTNANESSPLVAQFNDRKVLVSERSSYIQCTTYFSDLKKVQSSSHRFVGLSDSLPKTSNIKMVDVWMLFSLVLPFLDVILQTYCYLLSQGEEEKEEEKRETGTRLSRVRVGATTLTVSTKKNLKRYDA